MTLNLFSSFNPVSSKWTSIMWLTALSTLIMIPKNMWSLEPKILKIKEIAMTPIQKQMKSTMKKSMLMSMNMIMTYMMIIFLMNISGLFPFTFPQTSQPQITLGMALPMWSGIMMIKMKKMSKLMSHMVPPSTPPLLMPLMVIIESTSTIIQPITLSIRLMANITAGHILMTLISSAYSTSLTMVVIMMIQISFTLMEMFVSMIQAYVFSMLLTMYTK